MLAAGDVVWVDLDPVRGTEQAGRRPALVVSEGLYHEISTRLVICPISSTRKPWPFNVPLPDSMRTRGVVLVDQVRAIHRASRVFQTIEKAPEPLLAEVRRVLAGVLGLEVPAEAPDPGPT